MLKKCLYIAILIFSQSSFALQVQVKERTIIDHYAHYTTYASPNFPLSIHVITMSLDGIDIKLVPARGQREEVSAIARRSSAPIAINGGNYRRGGKYNGNRVNLLYLNNQVYTDVQLIRGSFGWNSKTKAALIDTIFLNPTFLVNGVPYAVDSINQPRAPGMSALYTSVADTALLCHVPGINIHINADGIVQNITRDVPSTIPEGAYIYQIDEHAVHNLQHGMQAVVAFKVASSSAMDIYNDYDFIIGGAGLLVHNGAIVSAQLYQEFSQGNAIVHCNDEVAADFHTKTMQEWLIEQRHPRTALGITNDHEICIVVVDGRQAASEGLTLHELANFMHQVGCVHALNMGGGGCSTLCIDGTVVNSPSAQQERPISEAICFFKR